MKFIRVSLLTITTILVFLINASAQGSTTQNTDSSLLLHVSGVCEMCKITIEKAAKGKGVNSAVWDMSVKKLQLTYDPKRTSLSKIKERIVDAGYDTDGQKADDKVYNQLPACCRYREFSSMEEMMQLQSSNATDTGFTDQASTPQKAEENIDATNNIRGQVFEKDLTGALKPLVGATVIWLGSRVGTLTDNTGSFNLPPLGQQRQLVVTHVGFDADTITVNEANDVKVVLSAGQLLTAGKLTEVRVTAGGRPTAFINPYDPIRKLMITPKELQKAACCNLSESFETNPSVDVSFNDAVTGSKQIQLLGLSGNYTQLTVENLPGPRGLATAQGLNSIPGTWIESIQLVKGTGSVVNGFESIAGQINVELKKPTTSERLFANVYVNDFGKTDLNLNLSQKIGKRWSTTLLLHDAFLNNDKIDFNGDGFRDLPTGNLFSAVNRWSFTNEKGLTTHFGIKLLNDDKVGGQISFDPVKDKLSTTTYGLQIKTARYEAFGKVGYVFPEKPHKSIGLQLSTFRHSQDSYFGLTTYGGEQQNIYANLIYQSIIGTTNQHQFKTGLSFQYDDYKEQFNQARYDRKEAVPGGFFEYTFSPTPTFDIVAGIRQDHNNLYGWFTTPRLNIRYQPFQSTVIRASVGRGQRTANIFAENNSVFVSARAIQIKPSSTGGAYGLHPEIAWNKGLSIDQKFRIFNRTANLSFEFFRNDFQDQVVVDLENPRTVSFYNLVGESYANSYQAEFSFEPVRKFNARLAYRYFDVNTTYGDKRLQKPFTARHRGFANLAYEVSDWKFDYTVSYNGQKRLPASLGLPEIYKRRPSSPAYTLMNAQVSKTVGKKRNIDLYLGGENLTNFLQERTITASEQPFGPYFDASQIWGPVNGRMLYGGLRFTLK